MTYVAEPSKPPNVYTGCEHCWMDGCWKGHDGTGNANCAHDRGCPERRDWRELEGCCKHDWPEAAKATA